MTPERTNRDTRSSSIGPSHDMITMSDVRLDEWSSAVSRLQYGTQSPFYTKERGDLLFITMPHRFFIHVKERDEEEILFERISWTHP